MNRAPSERASRRWEFAAAALGGVALVVAAYANHFRNGFHFDDSHVIEDNLFIRDLGHWTRFFTDAATFSTVQAHQTYRPLVTLSFALDYRLGGGLDPRVFQATQFVLHLLVVAGLFLLFRRVAERVAPGWRANDLLAAFAATWFGVHTANTETVNYLSSRSDVLSTLGVVGSFVAYLYVPRSRRLHLYLLPALLGALAKPPAVMFAPLLAVWILLFEAPPLRTVPREGRRRWALDAGRAVAPAMVACAAMFLFTSFMDAHGQSYEGGSPVAYLRTQAWVWVHYARLFVLPIGLTADTDWTLIAHAYDTRVIAGLAFLAALALTVGRTSTGGWRPVAFGLAWFGFGLLPSSSVVPLAEVMNEHRVYLPFAGLVLAATWAVAWGIRSRSAGPVAWRAAGVGGLVLLLAHAAGTSVRNRVWRTDETLWADVVAKSPGNGRALMNYGLTKMEVGRYEEARDLFLDAAEAWPRYAPAHVNLGVVYGAMRDTAAADAHFRQALDLDPDLAAAHFFYGRYLTEVGRAPEAVARLRTAMDLSPAWGAPRELLVALEYARANDTTVAELVEGTLVIDPTDAVVGAYAAPPSPPAEGASTYFQRGVDETAAGRHLDAAVDYRRHLTLHPDDPDALLNLGWSRAQLGFDELAAADFRRVLALRPDYDLAANNLAWVLGRMDRGRVDGEK